MLKTTMIFVLLASTLLLAEDSYIFEAKGKFAEELKALVEKYSKEGKIDVKVIKTNGKSGKSKRGSILSSLFGESGDVDIERGKEIYNKNCFKCHGLKAEKNTYANSRILSKMSREEIEDQIENYKRDMNYGGAARYVMYNSVDTLSSRDIKSVAAYIKSIGGSIDQKTEKKSEAEEESSEERSSYLQ